MYTEGGGGVCIRAIGHGRRRAKADRTCMLLQDTVLRVSSLS